MVRGFGVWDLGSGIEGPGFGVPGFRAQDSRSRIQHSGYEIWGQGLWVWNLGSRIHGLGFVLQDSWSGICAPGFMVWDSGSSRIGIQGHEFGVLGPGFGVRDSWSGAAWDSVSGIQSQGIEVKGSGLQ